MLQVEIRTQICSETTSNGDNFRGRSTQSYTCLGEVGLSFLFHPHLPSTGRHKQTKAMESLPFQGVVTIKTLLLQGVVTTETMSDNKLTSFLYENERCACKTARDDGEKIIYECSSSRLEVLFLEFNLIRVTLQPRITLLSSSVYGATSTKCECATETCARLGQSYKDQ